MKYLAIDTSGTWLTVACNGEKEVVRHIEDCRLNHSVILMDEIEKCLYDASIDAKDCDVFACAVGPGSFTGIRIGVSTIKAFCYAFNKKVLSVTSFESLAYNKPNGKDVLALIDARHDNYYICGFNGDKSVKLAPRFVNLEEAVAIAKEYDYIVSDNVVTGLNSEVVSVKDGFVNAVKCKMDMATTNRESIVPLYVKKSQAEEEII